MDYCRISKSGRQLVRELVSKAWIGSALPEPWLFTLDLNIDWDRIRGRRLV